MKAILTGLPMYAYWRGAGFSNDIRETSVRARVCVRVCTSVRSKCVCAWACVHKWAFMHVTAWVCVRKYATDCAYIPASVCGCVRMCIHLYSYASVHMRVRVHMRGCAHNAWVWTHECACATVVRECTYICVCTCMLVWANASVTAYVRVGPSCGWSFVAVKWGTVKFQKAESFVWRKWRIAIFIHLYYFASAMSVLDVIFHWDCLHSSLFWEAMFQSVNFKVRKLHCNLQHLKTSSDRSAEWSIIIHIDVLLPLCNKSTLCDFHLKSPK